MMTAAGKTIYYLLALLLLICTALAAYFQQPLCYCIPFLLLFAYWFIQHPAALFYLLMAAIPWSIEWQVTGSLGTDFPDEPLMLMASLAVLIWVLFRWRSIRWRQWHPILILLGLAWLWALLILPVSADHLHSLKFILAKSWYLLAFVGAPLLLWQDRQHLKKSVLVLMISMLIITVVTLIRHGMNGFTFEMINPSLEPFFRNHVNYSSLLVCMVPLLLAFYQGASSRLTKNIIIVLTVIVITALYLSYARGAWLALIAGIAAYWLIRKKLLAWSFFLVLVLSVSAVFWLRSDERFLHFSNDYRTTIFHSNFEEHLVATYKLKDMSTAERFYRWIAGVRMIDDSWKTGFGPNTFYGQYKGYTLPAFKTYVSNNPEHSTVHNYFLLLFIEQGFWGFLLFVLLVLSMLWYAQQIYHRTTDRFWKITMAAVASITIMLCVINFLSDMIETDKVGSMFYLCVAVIVAGGGGECKIENVKCKRESYKP